jgi:eukaryotic-like serine/threonine-protein kinase
MTDPARFGRYELLERIGQGTLGVLYRARDTVLGREVAVKVMAAGFLGDEGAHARFFHEARAAARLQHVNIVTVFEFGEQQETPFIVMEFLRGFSLAERLRQHPAMPLREKVDVAIQLCAGLEAAHKQGVIHRDVKPANVWLCLNGTVKLLDFGIATAASSNATVADVFASPGYMSPEQIEGREVDPRSDIFSAGAVVYEMLTGRHPFEADSPTAVMLKIVNDVPRRIDDGELPAALKTAVARALEKSPAARYARAADFGRDLKTVKAGMPNPRETATVIIDRSKLNLPPRPEAPAAPQPGPPALPAAPPARAEGVKWPILIAAALAIVLATVVIAWIVLSSP